MQIGAEIAETLALEALAWIAADDDLLPAFLAATGTDPASLRQGAGEAEVLAGVLDFLLSDDGWVRRFCDATGRDYWLPRAARAALPGASVADWA